MPTRIEIELTSTSPDGSWTWRAAGAREPRGVLDGSILPQGASVGDQLRVETEQDLDGIHVLSVVPPKEKGGRSDVLELLPTEERFEPVIQQRARGGRDDDRGRRPRRDRSDRPDRRDRPDRPPGDRPERADRRERADRGDRGERGDRGDRRGEGREPRRARPHFTPPPEVPQRPKPKRLRPGKEHRTEVLGSIAPEQRPVAELALQGLAAVRQRLREDNARLRAEGKPEMPEAAVMKMAEDLLPRLRVADWLDRADAAKRQLEHLDLRDLRSVVATSDDPLVARDEATRTLAGDLKEALLVKQEEELTLWLSDVEAALDVGRVVRALRLSSQPPKAGVPFPPALAARLGEATTTALQPADAPDRWIAVLEAAAFSPVRTHVTPTAAPEQASDELRATVKRLGPLLPQVAVLFGIEVGPGAHVPKPLRPTPRKQPAKQAPKPPRPARPARPERPPAAAGTAAERGAAAEPETAAAADSAAPANTEAAAEPGGPAERSAAAEPEVVAEPGAVPERGAAAAAETDAPTSTPATTGTSTPREASAESGTVTAGAETDAPVPPADSATPAAHATPTSGEGSADAMAAPIVAERNAPTAREATADEPSKPSETAARPDTSAPDAPEAPRSEAPAPAEATDVVGSDTSLSSGSDAADAPVRAARETAAPQTPAAPEPAGDVDPSTRTAVAPGALEPAMEAAATPEPPGEADVPATESQGATAAPPVETPIAHTAAALEDAPPEAATPADHAPPTTAIMAADEPPETAATADDAPPSAARTAEDAPPETPADDAPREATADDSPGDDSPTAAERRDD